MVNKISNYKDKIKSKFYNLLFSTPISYQCLATCIQCQVHFANYRYFYIICITWTWSSDFIVKNTLDVNCRVLFWTNDLTWTNDLRASYWVQLNVNDQNGLKRTTGENGRFVKCNDFQVSISHDPGFQKLRLLSMNQKYIIYHTYISYSTYNIYFVWNVKILRCNSHKLMNHPVSASKSDRYS